MKARIAAHFSEIPIDELDAGSLRKAMADIGALQGATARAIKGGA